MPQLGPMIVAAATAFKASAVGNFLLTTTVGKILTSTALSTAMTAMTTAISGKPQMNGGGISTKTTGGGAEIPRSIMLGYCATAGSGMLPAFSHDNDKHDNGQLTYVIALSDKPVDSLLGIIVDGKEFYEFEAQREPGHPGYHPDDQYGRRPVGKLNSACWVRFRDGRQTTADAALVNLFGEYPERPIKNTFIAKGVAYAAITFKYRAKDPKYSGLPQVKFVVKGARLFDPRLSTAAGGSGPQVWGDESTYTFSFNPIVAAYNFIRGITLADGHVYGIGADASALPTANWFAAMNKADAAGTQPDSTDWRDDITAYGCGWEAKTDQAPLTHIAELLKSASAQIAEVAGKYYVTVGAPSVAVAHITDDVVLQDAGAIEFRLHGGLDSTFNSVQAQFPNPRNLWETDDSAPIIRPDLEAEDDNRRLVANLQFPAVPWARKVRRNMRHNLADSRRQRQHTLYLPYQYIGLQPTQTITFSSAINGYSAKLFEVVQKTVDPHLVVKVVLRERDFSDYGVDPISDGRTPTAPSPVPVQPIYGIDDFAVQGITVGNAANTAGRPAIRMSYDSESSVESISYRIAATGVIVMSGNIPDLTQGFHTVADGILPATDYQVSARPVVRGAESTSTPWGAWLDVTTPDVRLSWDDLEDAIVDDFEALEEGMANTAIQVANTNAQIVTLRDDLTTGINNTINLLRGETANAVTTGVNTYNTTIVQPSLTSLTGQITQLQARITSGNLINNGTFTTNDFTGWTTVSTPAVIAKANSAIALMASCPRSHAAQMAVGRSISQPLQAFTATDDHRLQLRFVAAGAGGQAANRTVNVALTWVNAAGTTISTDTQSFVCPNTTAWHVVTQEYDPPATTASASITISNGGNSTYWLIAGIEGELYNRALEARVETVEIASANTANALASFQSAANVRMGTIEGSVSSLSATTANATNALSIRIDTAQARANSAFAAAQTNSTAIANANAAISQLDSRVTSVFGSTQLIRDPSFEGQTGNALTFWNGVLSNDYAGRIYTRNPGNANWHLNSMPGPKAFIFRNSDVSGGAITSNVFDVSPSEKYSYSFFAGAIAGGPVIRGYVQWLDEALTQVGTGAGIVDSDAIGIAGYKQFGRGNLVPATGATKARLVFHVLNAGTGTADAWGFITAINLNKMSAYDFVSAASIDTLNQAVANANSALAAYQVTTNAQIGSISASGQLRSYAMANTSVGIARIGLSVNASANTSNNSVASLYLEDRTDGTNGVYIRADRFALMNGSAYNSSMTSPFFIEGANTHIANAMIKNLSVDRLKIANGAVTQTRIHNFAATGTDNTVNSVQMGSQFTFTCDAPITAHFSFTSWSPANGGGANTVATEYHLDGELILRHTAIPNGGSTQASPYRSNEFFLELSAGNHTIVGRMISSGFNGTAAGRVRMISWEK